ncbi:Phage tail length tape-measure protein [Edwardsiella anguillarum ET080813]|uniref:Phage tail length tape-measure protein n=1 Tax=Edwardsiella anguillarum ET080813 TaxID=667120 RepID=A0A076LKQ0_9GAMM|nr:Phage tail length tape-measure protein [Edwardsiella anguillarum ET080813]
MRPIISWFTDDATSAATSMKSSSWGGGSSVSGYGYNQYQINQAQQKKPEGEITVKFEDAPPGMRVVDNRATGIGVNHDVGYTRISPVGLR